MNEPFFNPDQNYVEPDQTFDPQVAAQQLIAADARQAETERALGATQQHNAALSQAITQQQQQQQLSALSERINAVIPNVLSEGDRATAQMEVFTAVARNPQAAEQIFAASREFYRNGVAAQVRKECFPGCSDNDLDDFDHAAAGFAQELKARRGETINLKKG